MKGFFIDKDGKRVEFANAQLESLRVSDPVLTTLAQGYTNAESVSDALFPVVMGSKSTAKFPAFGQEAFKIHNTKRALGGSVARMLVHTGGVTLSLDEHSLGGILDDRELIDWAGTPEQLRNARWQMVADALRLEREYACAVLATTAGNYAAANKQSGAAFGWADEGNPFTHFDAGREAVRAKIGRYPNVAVFDPTAWKKFKNNVHVMDRIKYTQTGLVTEQIAAALLEIDKVVVGKMVYGTGTGGGVGESELTKADVWSSVQSGNVVLAHAGQGYGVPGFGYTYALEGYPQVSSYRVEEKKSEAFDQQEMWTPIITLAAAGYLMYSVA